MLKIDNSLLEEIGLGGLPETEKNSFLKHVYETLEMRVGIRLADQMTNEQLDEFEQYFEAKDDAGAFKWLETNFPNYKDIVQQEFDKLKAEVAQSAPQILAASQAAQAQAVQQPQPANNFAPPAVVPAPASPPAPSFGSHYAAPQQPSYSPGPGPAPSPSVASPAPAPAYDPAPPVAQPPQFTSVSPPPQQPPSVPPTPQPYADPITPPPYQPQPPFPPQQPPPGPPQ